MDDEQGEVGATPDTAVDPSDFEDAITEFSAVGKTRGHHLVPQAHYKDLPLLRETRKVFDEATTGPIRLKTTSEDGLLRGHYWDGPNGAHGQYSEAVGRLLRNYLSENGIEPRQMTPDQARAFLDIVRGSSDPRIRDYLNSIKLLQRLFRLRSGGRGIE